MTYCTNIHLLGVQHDETKAPAGFLHVPVGATFSLGENKVAIKYHIPSVETRPILGTGFLLGRNWA